MQQSIELAGEPIRAGHLCVVRNGGVYRFRHEPREEVLGVAVADAAVGAPISFLADGDAISEALLKDFVDRT